MNKDIETLRKLANRIYSLSQEQVQQELRAIADRMEKTESVAWMAEDGRLCSPATKTCAMHKSTAAQFSTPLFTRPASDESERQYAILQAERVRLSDKCVALEAQLSAIKRAIEDATHNQEIYEIPTSGEELIELRIIDWQAILNTTNAQPAQEQGGKE